VSAAADLVEPLVARWGLDSAAAVRLGALVEPVAADPAAPTAVHGAAAVVERHLADSLVALELEPVRAARRVADLGSGPGFPGLALAAALPDASVRLVESAARKCAFLERTIAAAGIPNAEVVRARAEAWEEGIEAHDVITARALAALPVVLEYAAPLLASGGTLVAWRGRRDQAEERAGAEAAQELGLEPVEVRRVQPSHEARDRHLHVFRKARPTPSRFPRRVGVARKRPLAGSAQRAGNAGGS
jgi:16S rRNA (guanine527-N7)-methyltransferase